MEEGSKKSFSVQNVAFHFKKSFSHRNHFSALSGIGILFFYFCVSKSHQLWIFRHLK